MKIDTITPSIGAEISGIALSQVAGEQLSALKDAVYEHGVVVLREQELSPEQHIAFAKRWGAIDINNYFPLEREHPEIAVVRKRPDQQTNIGGAWHTDHSYDQVPAMGSILVARDLPPSGGDTLFAHMGAAYDALPPDLKDAVEGQSAFHTADHVYQPGGIYAQTDMGSDLRGQELKTGATHPVVIRHPHNGRKLLYINPAFTIHFTGQTREESLPLMEKLFAVAMDPAHQCRLQWRPGTIAIWDNRVTWHNAMNDYQGHAREMHRITLGGEPLAA